VAVHLTGNSILALTEKKNSLIFGEEFRQIQANNAPCYFYAILLL
jgi:hypothetical protein